MWIDLARGGLKVGAGALVIERPRRWCTSWALWQSSKPVLGLVLAVNTAAVVATLATALMVEVSPADLMRFVVLLICLWASTELTRNIERKRSRKYAPYVPYLDTTGTWSFAAVIVLPPALASATVMATFLVSWCRVRRASSVAFRWVYSASTVLLGTQAAALVLSAGMHDYPGIPAAAGLDGLAELGVVAVAAVLRWVINCGLVMAAIALSNPMAQLSDLFRNFDQQFLEAGAMGLGLAVAFLMVTNPVVLLGAVVAMIGFQHAFLLAQYEHESRVDAKTGLATAGWWHEYAEQVLVRERERNRTTGLVIIDLDHFKAINDTHGHPFGDEVLQAVANALRAEVRDDDACGRWGGEEFAVVIPNVGTSENFHRAAERIRRRVQTIELDLPEDAGATGSISVTASIGGALDPADGVGTLDELLFVADSALYEAKNAGRNVVRIRHVESTTAAEPTPPSGV